MSMHGMRTIISKLIHDNVDCRRYNRRVEILPISAGSGPEDPGSPESGLVEAQQRLRRIVLDTVASPNSRRNYAKALDDLFALAGGCPLTPALFMEYRTSMEALSPSTTNVRLSAVRKLVAEARRNGMIGVEDAARLAEVPNIRQQGTRLGNWLTREQAKELLAVPDRSTLKGKRDYVILALLVGCALRRKELASLVVETIQLREGRWVLADLAGKGRRVRTVAVPGLGQAGNQLLDERGRNRGRPAAAVDLEGRKDRRYIERLGGLVGRRAIGERDWDRALRGPRPPPDMRQALPEGGRRPRTD